MLLLFLYWVFLCVFVIKELVLHFYKSNNFYLHFKFINLKRKIEIKKNIGGHFINPILVKYWWQTCLKIIDLILIKDFDTNIFLKIRIKNGYVDFFFNLKYNFSLIISNY